MEPDSHGGTLRGQLHRPPKTQENWARSFSGHLGADVGSGVGRLLETLAWPLCPLAVWLTPLSLDFLICEMAQ